MNFAYFRPRPCRLPGFVGADGFTCLFAQRLAHFFAGGLPYPGVVPVLVARALGPAGAGLLIGAIRPALLIADACGSTGRLAQPRRRAKQIGFDLAVVAAITASITAALAAPGIGLVAAFVAILVTPALRIELGFGIAGIESVTAAQAARRCVVRFVRPAAA